MSDFLLLYDLQGSQSWQESWVERHVSDISSPDRVTLSYTHPQAKPRVHWQKLERYLPLQRMKHFTYTVHTDRADISNETEVTFRMSRIIVTSLCFESSWFPCSFFRKEREQLLSGVYKAAGLRSVFVCRLLEGYLHVKESNKSQLIVKFIRHLSLLRLN